MNYGQIITQDVANGPGMRVSLFVSGCSRHCKGCFNEKTWDPCYGELYTYAVKQKILDELGKPYYQGLTILGGEPFEDYNVLEVFDLVTDVKEKYPKSDIWIYSGFLYEELMKDEMSRKTLEQCDVLVDGPFILEQRNLLLSYRGSENQRIINLNKSDKNHIELSPHMKRDPYCIRE